MAVRLADVAAEAGVSLATASRVLNGSSRRPKPEISERVKLAAERLGYFPNAQAQALARASAGLVGLVVHDIADPYFASIARGAQRALVGSGKQLMLASTERASGAEIEAVQAFMSYRTDAILLSGSRGYEDDDALAALLQTYRANGGRVAMIGQPLPDTHGVEIDNFASAGALARELMERGFTRFALLSGELRLSTSQQRAEGIIAALAERGLQPEVALEGAFTREGGRTLMRQLLETGDWRARDGQRLCVLCANDVMALGALAALREAGVSVPGDIALAGFDDIPTLEDQYPSVTTVRLPLEDIGHMGAQMLLSAGEDTPRSVVLGQPVLRDSTRVSAAPMT